MVMYAFKRLHAALVYDADEIDDRIAAGHKGAQIAGVDVAFYFLKLCLTVQRPAPTYEGSHSVPFAEKTAQNVGAYEPASPGKENSHQETPKLGKHTCSYGCKLELLDCCGVLIAGSN